MDNNNSKQDQVWQKCPKGMIQKVADRSAEGLSRIQLGVDTTLSTDRRAMLKIAAAIVVTAGAGTIAYRSVFAPVAPNTHGGLTCKSCVENLPKYMEKRLEDQRMVAKMDEHLRLCAGCRARFDQMKNA